MEYLASTFWFCFKRFWFNPWALLLVAIVILPAGNSIVDIVVRGLSLSLFFSVIGTFLIWLRDCRGIDI